MLKPTLACFLFLSCLLAAQTAAPTVVPVAEEPAHHLAFENEYVRVFKVEVAPHAATLMHRHDKDYVFVTLGDSEVISERQGEKPVTLNLKDGETRFAKGGFAHIARNLSDKPFRNVTVEILRPPGSFVCGTGQGVCAGAAGGITGTGSWQWSVIAESDKYLVRRVTIDPGGTVPLHEHTGPHLVVAISDLHLRNNVEGQQPAELILAGGDIKWVPSRFKHSVTNVSKESARLVTVEFK